MPKIKAGTNIYMLPEEKRINISVGDISMILATKYYWRLFLMPIGYMTMFG